MLQIVPEFLNELVGLLSHIQFADSESVTVPLLNRPPMRAVEAVTGLLNSVNPITGAAMQVCYRYDNKSVAINTVNDAVGKPR
jgi:hypothetical protein